MDLCPWCNNPENDHDPGCLTHSFKSANRPSALSDGLAKLVTLQEQYIAFIGEELEETAILASARGWKSKRFDEGVKLRTEMERLKGKLG